MWQRNTQERSDPGAHGRFGHGDFDLHPHPHSYTYDPLNRLTAADSSTGEFFHYAYDTVGNRLRQETHNASNVYAYDAANRLVEVDGVTYAWDANGNLIDDGERTYTYDHADRLSSVDMGSSTNAYIYNGLGDRLGQTTNGTSTNYVLDLAVGLTQVLSDGANDYLYGLGRIGEQGSTGWTYHLVDALGSVRQTVDGTAAVPMTRAYKPFGSSLLSAGNISTSYGFAGEWTDTSGLIHLRARYYAPLTGRFMQPDPWRGNNIQPTSLHPYLYSANNPILFRDPSGQCYGCLAFCGISSHKTTAT